ncbi:diamine acetyltransferase 1-like [Oppia nitens]|uniref:diamine acetyltransferase 1-like n=1 Tax=Oppia nitens TaxID=1686743 RepID=UPI0023DBD565|nr:diamine acetyltransferase 1-like [Oppia nitens]
MFTIRHGMLEDCPAVQQLIHELTVYQDMDVDRVPRVSQLQEDGFSDQLHKRLFRLIVAQVADNKLIGFVLYYPKYATCSGRTVWMDALYVQPDYRSAGVGRALMAAMARDAIQLSCIRMEWDCLMANKSAIDYYKRMGATDATSSDQFVIMRLNCQLMKQLATKESGSQ